MSRDPCNSEIDQVAQGCVQVWITPTQESSQPLWVIQHPGEAHSFLVPNWDVSLCCSLCPLPCVLSLCGSGMNLDSVSFITPSGQLKAAGGTPQSSPSFFSILSKPHSFNPFPYAPTWIHLHISRESKPCVPSVRLFPLPTANPGFARCASPPRDTFLADKQPY